MVAAVFAVTGLLPLFLAPAGPDPIVLGGAAVSIAVMIGGMVRAHRDGRAAGERTGHVRALPIIPVTLHNR